MSRDAVRERLRDVQQALEEAPRELVTGSSPDSIRSSSSGLARIPFLTINDIIQLRGQGIDTIDGLEAHYLDVPASTWPHVLDLVRARILRPAETHPPISKAVDNGPEGGASRRCLALTKKGDPCRNQARDGSKYCSSHKGYQPTPEEVDARQLGLLPGP